MIKCLLRVGGLGGSVLAAALAAQPDARLTRGEERLISALPVVPAGLNAAYRLEEKPTKVVEATYEVNVTAPNLKAEEWVLLLPKAGDLPGQRIIASGCKPKGEVVADRSALQQPLWRVRIPVDGDMLPGKVGMVVKTRAELSARRLLPRGSTRAGAELRLSAGERILFLRRTAQCDYDSAALAGWSAEKGLQRGTREGEVDFARRVFLVLVRGFGYEYLGDQDRAASHVCKVAKSDCGGLSGLFVAVMRAQGVPARTRAGRWADSAKRGDRIGQVEYFQEHVKAEFFAQGVGWVPVDVSSGVLHDKTPERLAYFGNDRGDFLTLHLDDGLVFDTIHFGSKRLPLMQRATYWASGEGDFTGTVMREQWLVEPLPGGAKQH